MERLEGTELLHYSPRRAVSHESERPTVLIGEVGYSLTGLPQSDFGDVDAVQLSDWSRTSMTTMRVSRRGVEAGMQQLGVAFGMPPAARRALGSLYRHCDVRRSAESLGISYETVREHLETARKAVGAPTLPRLLTFSIVSVGLKAARGGETDHVFQRVFDLTERQTRLAGFVANGSTRREAARILHVSEAVAKVELSMLFAATGVENGLELARLLAETRVLVALTTKEEFSEPYPPPSSRTDILQHPDGRRIAVSDYGPAHGRPALVMHSSMTSRPVNRALVEALQDAGFRPISIDRPGFGDSDPAPHDHLQSYFEIAGNDMAFVCKAMGLPRVYVITRGAAQAATTFHARHGALVARMVIMNPDPDLHSSHRTSGIFSLLKQNFKRRPKAIAAMARVFAVLSSYERISDNLIRVSTDCPADAAIMSDAANRMDYYRGVTAMRDGQIGGFVAEQVGMATTKPPEPRKGTTNISLLVGEFDFIHEPADTIAYWREALPDARLIIVEGGGRFIAYSHAALAVAELGRA